MRAYVRNDVCEREQGVYGANWYVLVLVQYVKNTRRAVVLSLSSFYALSSHTLLYVQQISATMAIAACREDGVCRGSLWKHHCASHTQESRRSNNERSKCHEYCVLIGNTLRSYPDVTSYRRGDFPAVSGACRICTGEYRTYAGRKAPARCLLASSIRTNFLCERIFRDKLWSHGENLVCIAPFAFILTTRWF